MSEYRYTRPVTAALVLTVPIWAPVCIGLIGVLTVIKEAPEFFRGVKDAAKWSIGEPIAIAARATVRSAQTVYTRSKAATVRFVDYEMGSRAAAALHIVADPVKAAAHALEGYDVKRVWRDLKQDMTWSAHQLIYGYRY